MRLKTVRLTGFRGCRSETEILIGDLAALIGLGVESVFGLAWNTQLQDLPEQCGAA
jgi:hypothetical protein